MTFSKTYLPPEIEIFYFEYQSVLATSGNPSITNPTLPWESQKKSPFGTMRSKKTVWGNYRKVMGRFLDSQLCLLIENRFFFLLSCISE